MNEDQDVDVESDFDEDEDDDGLLEADSSNTQFMTPAEKRAHHNALERKRRDHIKESFLNLRDAVPSLYGEKVGKGSSTSRSQILKQATDYIQFMTKKNGHVQTEISELKRQNRALEQQVNAYDRSRGVSGSAANHHSESSDGSDDAGRSPRVRSKRIKTVAK